MKLYTTINGGPMVKRDASLCKVKVKAKQRINGMESKDPQQLQRNKSEKEDVQRYVVASKKRTIVLQFESPVQKKKKNRKSKQDVAPDGAVQGIKNLRQRKNIDHNRKVGTDLIETMRSGEQGLEGTYIHVDERITSIESVGFESLDKDDTDWNEKSGYDDEDNEEEEEVVEVEKDDNYYRSFLNSIHCRMSVKQLRCYEDVKCDYDNTCANKTKVTRSNPPAARHTEALEPMATKLLSNWSGEVIAKNDDYHKYDVYKPPQPHGSESLQGSSIKLQQSNDYQDHGNRTEQESKIELQQSDDYDDDYDNDDDIIERSSPQKDSKPTDSKPTSSSWGVDNFIGSIMNFNPCANLVDMDCQERYRCGPEGREELQIFYDDDDDMTELSFEPPTALYAAIGTQNWNVALRRLIEAPEEASVWVQASEDDDSIIEFLPLHLACLTKAPLLLVTLLVQTYPEAVESDAMGKLPIHMACQAQADYRIVFLLLSRYLESLEIEDDDGKTPIALASLADSSPERGKIIQVLTKNMENTVVTTPTALYHAIDSQDWNFAMRRVVELPQESTIWVSFRIKRAETRFLPLHAACLMGAPLLLVQDLIQAYPDAVRKKTLQGNLPLHLACESLVDDRIVQLLLDQYQEAMNVKNFEGNTPIEIAYKSDPCPERSNIVEIFASMEENGEEKIVFVATKLYSLCQKRAWDDAVRRVLDAPDEAFTWVGANPKMTSVKCIPLHIACALRAPLIVIACLVQSYADSVKKTTSSGKLPIHIACEKGADHRVISFLLHSWPESFHMKDNSGKTCVQLALLSKPGDQKTKNLECLMAFESKGGEPLIVEGLEVIEDKQFGDIPINNNIVVPQIPDQVESNGDNMKNSGLKKQKVMKHTYYTKRKRFFGGKISKTLWKSDEEMFQSE